MAITLTQSPVLKSLSTTVVVALFITASSTLTALSTQANAQDSMQVQVARGYPLGAGDILRLEFLNRPDIRLNIQVELTGYANFPFIGAVLVGGRTIEELRAELPVLLDGAVLREEVGNDLRSNKVDSSELILSVLTYRPVVVAGDVAEPGEVEFFGRNDRPNRGFQGTGDRLNQKWISGIGKRLPDPRRNKPCGHSARGA